MTAKPVRPRRTRLDRITTAWMLVAGAILVFNLAFGASLPQQWWTAVHIVTLGVITNAILQWSWYFARALLRLAPDDRRPGRDQTLRMVLFNLSFVGLIVGMWLPNAWAAVGAATAVGVVIIWHTGALASAFRSALGVRFAVIIRYYVAAAVMLLVGIVYGALTVFPLVSGASAQLLVDFQDQTSAAHSLVNGLGFVGLTIAGTLVTLGPTALRTRMDDRAVSRALRALPILGAAVLGAALAVTFGLFSLAAVSVLAYAAAASWGIGAPLTSAAFRKPPAEVTTWNFAAGLVWVFVGLLWLSGSLMVAEDAVQFRESARTIVAVLGAGGVLQILVGALGYLLPVVSGGGPAAVRVGIDSLEAGGGFRLATRNAALLTAVSMAAGGGGPISVFAGVVATTYLLEVLAFATAGIRQSKQKRDRSAHPARRPRGAGRASSHSSRPDHTTSTAVPRKVDTNEL